VRRFAPHSSIKFFRFQWKAFREHHQLGSELLLIKAPMPRIAIVNKILILERRSPRSIKTGVERAIETDEETATDWINEQLAILGIELT
jgi:hypothetical protein